MNFLKTKTKLGLLFLLTILFIPTIHSMEKTEIELVSKDDQKIRVNRNLAQQSGLLSDMLEEEDDEDEEIPSLPVPNIESAVLRNIITLMKVELEKETFEEQKEELAKFIEDQEWNIDTLMNLLQAANYLDTPLILKALAYVIAEHKITKKILENERFARDLFFVIESEYINRFTKIPMDIFSEDIITDLKNQQLYDKAMELIMSNKLLVPLYEKDKIQLGSPVNISIYIKGFPGFIKTMLKNVAKKALLKKQMFNKMTLSKPCYTFFQEDQYCKTVKTILVDFIKNKIKDKTLDQWIKTFKYEKNGEIIILFILNTMMSMIIDKHWTLIITEQKLIYHLRETYEVEENLNEEFKKQTKKYKNLQANLLEGNETFKQLFRTMENMYEEYLAGKDLALADVKRRFIITALRLVMESLYKK